MQRNFMMILGISGAFAVALGAFGAHSLEGRISPDLLQTFETATRYQFYHTLALIAVVLAGAKYPTSRYPTIAGWLFVAGILLFSGSLYVLVFTGQTWLGAITPLGGVSFIVGWLLLALAAWKGSPE